LRNPVHVERSTLDTCDFGATAVPVRRVGSCTDSALPRSPSSRRPRSWPWPLAFLGTAARPRTRRNGAVRSMRSVLPNAAWPVSRSPRAAEAREERARVAPGRAPCDQSSGPEAV